METQRHGGIGRRHPNGHAHPSPGLEPVIFIPLLGLGLIFCLRGIHRLVIAAHRHQRLQRALREPSQRRFVQPNVLKSFLNRHLIHAPLFRHRHNREFRSSGCRGFHLGTLPTRTETIFLGCYIALNAAFCIVSVRWMDGPSLWLRDLRDTMGALAVGNLVPLVITAGRQNPLIPLLNISFDTFNLVHRWIGRVIVVEAMTHAVAVLVGIGLEGGIMGILYIMFDVSIFEFGLVAILAFVLIVCLSISPLRHAFYETFLLAHNALAVVAFIALWYHTQGFPQRWFLFSAIACWVIERFVRFCTIIWRNCGKSFTTATIQTLPGNVVRVDVSVPRFWKPKAGQYVYLYLPTLGLWTSHPFTVAWTDEDSGVIFHSGHSEKGITLNGSCAKFVGNWNGSTKRLSLLVRERGGITRKMAKSAMVRQGRKLRVFALVEGPLGGIRSFDSYGTVFFIAGGIGITYPLTHLWDLLNKVAQGTVATRRLSLLWVIQSADHLRWIQTWMRSIISHPSLLEVINTEEPWSPCLDDIEFSIPDPMDVRSHDNSFHSKQYSFQQRKISLSIHIHITSYRSSSSTLNEKSSFSVITDFDDNRPCWTKSASATVPITMSLGKPLISQALEREMAQQVGAMAVSVCGPGSMGDDVRHAVREVQGKKTVDFFEEAFSW